MSTLTEDRRASFHRGKWSVAGVPHKGWKCVDLEDQGKATAICEMCEAQSIRYVHVMEHPEYKDVLRVGCICAGHMEQDPAAARAREARATSEAARRVRWLSRSWRVSAKGNRYVTARGYRTTVYPARGGWKFTVAAVEETNVVRSHRSFATSDEAKLAAFDQILRLQTDSPEVV